MERIRFDHEYNDITNRAAANGGLPAIDVTEAVMKRIAGEAASGRKGQTPFMRPVMKRTTAFSGALMLLLLLSVSAYAASQYIEIRNAAGEIKVKTIDEITPQTDSAEDSADNKAYQNYLNKAQKFAKPGELVAFYVLGTDDLAHYTYKEQPLTNYETFKQEAERTNAQQLPQTINGYSFISGKIAPRLLITDADKQTAAYKQALLDLKQLAAAGTKGKKLFMQTVPWREASVVSGKYTKGHYKFNLTQIPLDGGEMHLPLDSKQKTEQIQVGETAVIYTMRTINEKIGVQYAQWYDESKDAIYMLTDQGNKGLSKKELLALAGDWIKVLK
ncbi:hypothetical protein ABEW34_06130 [Paenibacillus algorifonticola]|uniref:hypothetical protein n=1 Tax=Paenibacillus algorifonticola TaxID=684063 RepID=UPI003D2D15EB